MTDNYPQSVSEFFAALCASSETKRITTTDYHPQASGQAERFDRTLAARLQRYIGEHQTDCDSHVRQLTYD